MVDLIPAGKGKVSKVRRNMTRKDFIDALHALGTSNQIEIDTICMNAKSSMMEATLAGIWRDARRGDKDARRYLFDQLFGPYQETAGPEEDDFRMLEEVPIKHLIEYAKTLK